MQRVFLAITSFSQWIDSNPLRRQLWTATMLLGILGVGMICMALFTGCTTRYVGLRTTDVQCGYHEQDPDAQTVTAITQSLDALAATTAGVLGLSNRRELQGPSAELAGPDVSALARACVEADTCVHWDGDSCTVIRGGKE